MTCIKEKLKDPAWKGKEDKIVDACDPKKQHEPLSMTKPEQAPKQPPEQLPMTQPNQSPTQQPVQTPKL